ncbi:MICOS complex subunit MIC27 [Rhinichthys klamathensis goyatoka]|uniref:MICOS complex subunit MIC27 n=1 Tax=Rhinichthys klamathensis goyatoka TaxID=3034132 RepID=UPI0024B490F0|nr:MICOS complex subunit MIC27 [Rhinichthys klamathensis goyatoka]
MAAKILKYAALPAAAAVGLGSLRIYSMNEKNNEELISPRELSIYSPDVPAVPLVEEPPGVVQTGLGAVRTGLQPYVRAAQSALTSVKVGVISVYQAGQDTYHFLRDPPPGFLPRVGVIGVSGLGGLVLARKGSRLKRIVVPLGLATAGTAVCYPTQTVAVLKITGKKVYTVSSSVASMLKSKPKEDVIMSAVSVESAVAVTSPDTESPVKALSELSPESEPSPAVSVEEVTPISKAESVELSPVADIVSEDVVEPPSVVDLTTGIASPLSEPESPPALETAPVTDTTPEPVDGTVRDAESTLEPVAETVKESTPEPPVPEPVVKTAPEAAPADCVEDTAPSAEANITPLEESDPEIVPEAAPASPEFEVPAPTVGIEESTPSTTSTVEETTPPAPILPEDTTPTTVDEELASVEEAIPLNPPPAEEAPPSSQPPVLEPATIKSRFVPDPSLLDHGQSNPEDADMYSTRS